MKRIYVECHSQEAQKAVFRCCDSLIKEDVPAIYSRSNFVFGEKLESLESLDISDFLRNELNDYVATKTIEKLSPANSTILSYAGNSSDYRSFLHSCLRSFHKGKGYRFHARKGTLKVNIDKIPAGATMEQPNEVPTIVKGISLQFDTSRPDRILLKVDAFAEIVPHSAYLSDTELMKLRKHAMVSPKERYDYVSGNIKKVFSDVDNIELRLPGNLRLHLERVDFS